MPSQKGCFIAVASISQHHTPANASRLIQRGVGSPFF